MAISLSNKEVIIDSKMLKSMAQLKLFTINPFSKELANSIMSASMMSMKSPKVTMVMGADKRIRMGLMNVFNKPSTMDIAMAVR